MYLSLGSVTLRSGERVEAGVVIGPDAEWRDRILRLLWHKGEPWNWQNAQALTLDLGIDARFYVLHRDGEPFSIMMTATLNGVGLFGHVWTVPEDREQGAASALMGLTMEDFRARDGQALFLETGWGSTAYYLYQRLGFRSVVGDSALMEFYTTSREAFEADYFRPGLAEIQRLNWSHWPAAQALFVGAFPGQVRAASLGLLGRGMSEGPLLPLIREHVESEWGRASRAYALMQMETQAVTGFAMWGDHPLWPSLRLVDVYCHPTAWERAGDLLDALALPEDAHCVAYADREETSKMVTLQAKGFTQAAVLPRRIANDTPGSVPLDILVFEKGG